MTKVGFIPTVAQDLEIRNSLYMITSVDAEKAFIPKYRIKRDHLNMEKTTKKLQQISF